MLQEPARATRYVRITNQIRYGTNKTKHFFMCPEYKNTKAIQVIFLLVILKEYMTLHRVSTYYTDKHVQETPK